MTTCRQPAQARRSLLGSALSLCRNRPPQKIGIHNPPLLAFGFTPNPLDVVREPFQIARHEYLVVGSEVGTPVDIDLRIVDVLEGTFCVEHHYDIVDVVRQSLGYPAPGCDMNRLADPVQRDSMSCGQRLDATDARNHLEFECHGSSGNDLMDDP